MRNCRLVGWGFGDEVLEALRETVWKSMAMSDGIGMSSMVQEWGCLG